MAVVLVNKCNVFVTNILLQIESQEVGDASVTFIFPPQVHKVAFVLFHKVQF